MDLKKHIRHCLLWLYDKDNSISSVAASKELKEVYGDKGFGQQACAKWLKRFREGDKGVDDLEDEPRSGRPSNLNDEELRLLIEMNPKATVRELAEVLQRSAKSVWNHLRDMGFVGFFVFFYSFFKGQQAWGVGSAPSFGSQQSDSFCGSVSKPGEARSRKFEF